ncbi:DUF742 domain-containing protein [Streptomyces acidicola]|uniref:DUF742 domain-containing protein n=1 Tax=Streptomyces acidicola TaxID=2596892 RepID=A0A5N8WSE2_9ACTN|nr:DUF742 domain-containing protein [Streptomyces acidicola]MPY50189.1 DUF742 domain-containing protein [Streptomyces acidicola]
MTPPRRRRRYPKENPPPPPQPAGEDAEAQDGPPPKNPERLYIITGAAVEDGERAPIDLVTLIVASAELPPSATPEQSALLRICQAPLSVAEISAYLNLPFSVVTVLLTELLAAELVQARAPVVRQARADRSLLEAVMHGLQKL